MLLKNSKKVNKWGKEGSILLFPFILALFPAFRQDSEGNRTG